MSSLKRKAVQRRLGVLSNICVLCVEWGMCCVRSGRCTVCGVGDVLCVEWGMYCVWSGGCTVCGVGDVLCVEWEMCCVWSGRCVVCGVGDVLCVEWEMCCVWSGGCAVLYGHCTDFFHIFELCTARADLGGGGGGDLPPCPDLIFFAKCLDCTKLYS